MAKTPLAPRARVVLEGLGAFRAVTRSAAGMSRHRGQDRVVEDPGLIWVNTVSAI